MKIVTSFRIATRALGRHKLRTALTMLGIVIGVAAVLTMVALGNGAQASVEEEVKSAGTPLIDIRAGNYTQAIGSATILEPWEFAVLDPAAPRPGAGRGAAYTLSREDADAIGAEVAGVKYRAAGVTERTFVRAGETRYFTRIEGTDVDLPRMQSWNWTAGRFFTADEVAAEARVVVLGSVAARKLFGAEADPVGRPVVIRDEAFTVVGVNRTSIDLDAEAVFVPFTTLQRLVGIQHLHGITVAAESAGVASRVASDITALLRERHGLNRVAYAVKERPRFEQSDASALAEMTEDEGIILVPEAPDLEIPNDFTVRTQAGRALTLGLTATATAFVLANLSQLDNVTLDELRNSLDRANDTMTVLLASIAAVSLFVGGIGIMNIMLVSVTERTQEIGLRMTVGARGRDVLLQFLVEALTLSLLGGLVGIAAGFAASGVISRLLGWPAVFSIDAIALAFGIAAAIGVFFGFYPAHKASRLDPVTAVRYE